MGASPLSPDVAQAAERLQRPRRRLGRAPGTEAGHTRPRRLMAPGLTGPAQRWAADPESAGRRDLRLMSGAARRRTASPS